MKKIVSIISLIVFQLTCMAQAPSIQWQKCIGSSVSEVGNGYTSTSDGGSIVAGRVGPYGQYNYYIVKFDETGAIQWEKSLGGSGDDLAMNISQTSDNGYIVVGSGRTTPVVSGTFSGIWVVKLDATGNQQWQTYTDTGAVGNSIIQTTDGGYILAANKTYSGQDFNYYIVKLDANGGITWQKDYGGSAIDLANCIRQTVDGGYIVTGQTYSNDGDVTNQHGNTDIWILKLDSLGDLEWQRTYGGAGVESASSIELTEDGGYITVGFSNLNSGDVSGVYGNPDFWIVKLNTIGDIQWQKAYGGDNFDRAVAVKQTIDNGYIIVGSTNSNNSGYISGHHGIGLDVWVVRINEQGTFQWQKSLGGTSDDSSCGVIQNADGSYIISGSTFSNNGDVSGNNGSSDIWLVKLNSETLNVANFSSDQFSIYPNPCSNFLSIDSKNGQLIKNISIIDTSGKTLTSGKGHSTQIDVSSLKKGIYLINILTQEGEFSQKFIKN